MADSTSSNKTLLRTFVWLALFVAVGFGLRAYFGAEVAFDETTGRQLFTGNDPYYHWRTVSHVMETGQNLNYDGAINYPEGNWNPNPPLWTWTTAPVAVALQAMGVADPAGTALDVMVAVWGALIVIPVFMITRALWGRTAGLWSAFFMAFSAPHIERSVWGYADHDAISLFFIFLAAYFLIRALQQAKAPAQDAGPNSPMGFSKTLWADNRTAFLYAALAGVALSATAVTWKGYPYTMAILAVGLAVQLIVDRFRKVDPSSHFAVYMVALGTVVLLPFVLVYHAFPTFQHNTVIVGLYVLGGAALLGLFMVPTRRIPPVLLFPGAVAAMVLGFFGLKVMAPDIFNSITSGLGYFQQSKLYSTIGEAQRPSLGRTAAELGFFSFLLAFWGFGHAVRKTLKGDAPHTALFAFSIVSMFLMFAAARFVSNAAPIFCILLGWPMAYIISRMKGEDVRKRFRAMHGQNAAKRTIQSLTWPSAIGGLMVGLLLILPNVWIGVDAGIHQEYEAENLQGLADYSRGNLDTIRSTQYAVYKNTPRLGAFGIGFELSSNGWGPVLQTLSQQDLDKPMLERPAFLAWWDYGHWATALGAHPTVADPFQSHYEMSGRILASDSETEAFQFLSLLLLTGDHRAHGGYSAPVQAVIANHPYLTAIEPGYWYDPQIRILQGNQTSAADALALYEELVSATGKRVGYLAASDLMFPYDDPNTPYVDRPGIFYAPVFLANKNPDDYVQTILRSDSTTVLVKEYGVDADGNSYRLSAPVYEDTSGNTYVEHRGYLYRPGQTPLQGFAIESGMSLAEMTRGQFTQAKFSQTIFAKAFGGLTSDQAPGQGLAHWRAIDQSLEGSGEVQLRRVVLLAYAQGVQASGRITGPDGSPLAGVTVTFGDGFGALHARATTDADGKYTVRAPFSQDGDLSLVVLSSSGQPIYFDNSTKMQFTKEQAEKGEAVPNLDAQLQTGTATGRIYEDVNKNGKYDAANDTLVAGAEVSLGGQTLTTTSDGAFAFTVAANSYTASVATPGYQDTTRPITVPSGGAATPVDIAVTAKPSQVHVTYTDAGTPVEGIAIKMEGPTPLTVSTNATGQATASLAPGIYTFTVDQEIMVGGVPTQHKATQSVSVPFGGQDVTVVLTRQV